ncbi:MAG: hypothetical protein JW955_13095 [Sedimentisphaerales bacterium]|nr:hypothetical protein [Sedimentisphaerales bacterium]
MGTCARIAVVAVLLLALAPGAQGQRVIRITLEEKPETGQLTAEETTRHKMERGGTVDGQNWSINLDMVETPLSKALDHLVELAAAKPREIKVVYNGRDFGDAGVRLDAPVTVKMNDLSFREALQMVLGAELGYEVREDGTVVIAPRGFMPGSLPLRVYDIRNVLATLRVPAADPIAAANASQFVFPVSDMPAEEHLRQLIERSVRSTEPWESMGGRATIDFTNSGLMLIANADEAHRQIVALCKGLLVVDRERRDDLRQRVQEVEASLANLRKVRASLSANIRDLSFEGDPASLGNVVTYGPVVVLNDIQGWQRQIHTYRAEVVSRRAELEAQKQLLAEMRAAAERELADNPLYVAAQQRVERCRAALKAMLEADKASDTAAIAAAIGDLEREEAQLTSLAGRAGSNRSRVSQMEDAISQTWARLVRAEGQQKATEAELEAINPKRLLELADEIDALRRQRDVLDRRIDERQQLADVLRRRLDGVPDPPRTVAPGAAEQPAAKEAGEASK